MGEIPGPEGERRMQPRCAAAGRQPDDRCGLVAPESSTPGPSVQGSITASAIIDESVLDLEPDDAEGTTGDSHLHRIAHDRPRQPPPQHAMSHGGETPDIEASHAFHTTEAPKAIEKTLLTPGLRCRTHALVFERGTTVHHDSRPRCRSKVDATARMRSTAQLPHLPAVGPILHVPSSRSPATD